MHDVVLKTIEATVGSDGLELHDHGILQLPAGISYARIEYSDLSIDVASLQIRLKNAVLRSVEHQTYHQKDSTPPPDHSAQKIELLSRQIGAKSLLTFLDSLAPQENDRYSCPDTMWRASEHILQARTACIQTLDECERQLEALEQHSSPNPPKPDGSVILLQLETTQTSQVHLDIVVNLGWATWRPSFEVHVSNKVATVQLEASIWHPVTRAIGPLTLHLSHKPLALASTSYALTSWRVGPDPAFDERTRELYAKSPSHPSHRPQRAPAAPAQTHLNEPLAPFPTDYKQTHSIDDATLEPRTFRILLGQQPATPRIIHICRPAIVNHAHAILEIAPQDEAAWPGDSVHLTLDNSRYQDLPNLRTARAGTPWIIDLGPEYLITTQRKVLAERRSQGSLQREDIHQIRVEVEVFNQLPHHAEIIIEDQLPIASDPRLRISLEETTPEAEIDKKKGLVQFISTLEPERSLCISFSYRIEAPHNYRIIQALGRTS